MKPSELMALLAKYDDTYKCIPESGKMIFLKYIDNGVVSSMDVVEVK